MNGETVEGFCRAHPNQTGWSYNLLIAGMLITAPRELLTNSLQRPAEYYSTPKYARLAFKQTQDKQRL